MKPHGPLAPPHDGWSPEALPTLVRFPVGDEWHRVTGYHRATGMLIIACNKLVSLAYAGRNTRPGAIYGDAPANIGEPRCEECEGAIRVLSTTAKEMP